MWSLKNLTNSLTKRAWKKIRLEISAVYHTREVELLSKSVYSFILMMNIKLL